jgi:hypothetical protein
MGTFIRFVEDQKQAVADFDRGYSLRAYEVFSTVCEALQSDFVQNYGVSEDDIVPIDGIGFGFRLRGLCGFDYGHYGDTDEFLGDTIAAARSHASDNYDAFDYSFVAIFEGEYLEEADGGDGDVFRATRLVTVVKL